MKQQKIGKKATPKAPPRGGSTHFKPVQGSQMYSPAQRERLRLVRMHLDEGHGFAFLSSESGVSPTAIAKWVATYKAHGEAGLKDHPRHSKSKSKTAENSPVTAKIVELKRENPDFGVKRISQFLRRMFFLEASPSTVRATLQEENLMPPTKKKKKKNPPKPRFFERDTPNQMWQSDIFTFRLGGKNAYLIGFVDDYSRYMVGLDLFRSQTAENVLELFRTAMGEYGVPKEMLTPA